MKSMYAFLRLMNDLSALLNGRIGRRAWNKGVGRTMGRLMK